MPAAADALSADASHAQSEDKGKDSDGSVLAALTRTLVAALSLAYKRPLRLFRPVKSELVVSLASTQ